MSASMLTVLVPALLAFSIVLTGMALLWGMTVALGRLVTRLPGEATASVSDETARDDHLIAILTAAASEALGRPVVVHRVHVHRAAERDRWSRAGRLDVMVSHRVGPRR